MTAKRKNLTTMKTPGSEPTAGPDPVAAALQVTADAAITAAPVTPPAAQRADVTYSPEREAIERFRGVPKSGPKRLSDAEISTHWFNLPADVRDEYLKAVQTAPVEEPPKA